MQNSAFAVLRCDFRVYYSRNFHGRQYGFSPPGRENRRGTYGLVQMRKRWYHIGERQWKTEGDRMENALWGAMKKVLLETEKPSVYFEALRAENALSPTLAPLAALIGVPQNPAYHAEGDVWNHTMLVLDSAAALRPQARQPLGFMLAALCHDLGKALTTQEKDGRIISHGHEQAGLPLTRKLLAALKLTDPVLTDHVCNMVKLHMRPNALAAQGSSEKATNRLFRESVCPADLVLLAAADRGGRITTQKSTDDAAAEYLEKRLALFLAANAETEKD